VFAAAQIVKLAAEISQHGLIADAVVKTANGESPPADSRICSGSSGDHAAPDSSIPIRSSATDVDGLARAASGISQHYPVL
jgi:hypothetical protein